MIETESGTLYTSPFFLLAAVLWGPKLASGKKFSGTATCTRGNTAATPENTKQKTCCSYDFASDHCVFVKNHLGSTMATVDDRGRYDNGRAQDYLAYGSSKDLKVNGVDPVTQKFAGKELELLTGLYAFGWRWQDPELGMFMSPDPAGQFYNPYSYVGGNPINRVDPNGLESDEPPTKNCGEPTEGDKPCTQPAITSQPDADPVAVVVIAVGVVGAVAVDAFEDIGGLFRKRHHASDDAVPSKPQTAGVPEATAVPFQPPTNYSDKTRYWREGVDLNYLYEKPDFYTAVGADADLQDIANHPGKVFMSQARGGLAVASLGMGGGTVAPELAGGESAILQEHLSNAVAAFEREGFTRAQADAIALNPRLEAAFRGSRIDQFFKEAVVGDNARLGHLSVTPNFKFGPDVYNPSANMWWDVTTGRQWGAHVEKYGQFGTGTPLIYRH